MKNLNDYKVLSFDCYGTLIDWEAGLLGVLRPWADEHSLELSNEDLLLAYADGEAAVMREFPSKLYPELLAAGFQRAGNHLGTPVSLEWAQRMGSSVPDWPAFPDSADALQRLGRHYDLVILSNVHHAGFEGSNEHLRGEYANVITAEDVGAYKPASPHFEALLAWLQDRGLHQEDLLHVAQSLFHDHVPARKFGLDSVWINRRHNRPGWGATPEPAEQWKYDAEFSSMDAFASAVEKIFGAEG
jgi:2-haloacid dehalogenase